MDWLFRMKTFIATWHSPRATFGPSDTPRGQTTMSTAVLVADNSATMRKIIIRSLNALGIVEVAEAADGFEALELFQANSFKLVVTEWIMPQVSGLDVIRVIRKQGSNVPI